MSDNEITMPQSSAHSDDPADPTTASHRDDPPDDPRIAALKAMFPDYDDSALQSILESVGGDQNSAIELLLGMSDPQYKSETQHDHVQTLSQVDLDEQLARRLMLEEHHAQHEQMQTAAQQHIFPYEPYTRSARRSHRAQQQPQAYSDNVNNERDTTTEIQDRLGRIAETGKRTFGGLFSKVKARIQEYEKPSKPEPPDQKPPAPSQRWSYNSTGFRPAQHHELNPSTSSAPPLPVVATKSLPSALTLKGYDVDTEQTAGSTGTSQSESGPASDVSSPRTSTGSRPITAIDGGKLGLLPKKPVSLLKQQGTEETEAAKEQVRKDSIESNDELEYAENPFEESRN